MENSIVEKICGKYPENFKKIDIDSNPNFIFQNDTLYETINVFDKEGNTASVNSFLECEHYVSGGWDVIPIERSELYYLNVLSTVVIFAVFLNIFFRKKINLNNE